MRIFTILVTLTFLVPCRGQMHAEASTPDNGGTSPTATTSSSIPEAVYSGGESIDDILVSNAPQIDQRPGVRFGTAMAGLPTLVFTTLPALGFTSRPVSDVQPVFPGETWEVRKPAEVGMDAERLEAARAHLGGRGCIVRHGYVVYSWGDQAARRDIASAVKPFYAHFLFKAVEDKRLPSVDERVVRWEPCLEHINAELGHKDREITFRHMANQTSCYGVTEPPGTAYAYSDWQMALFFDTLFLKVYKATYETLDEAVFAALLTDPLKCEDKPTMLAFGTGDRPGRTAISVRDFARFGLLYLRQGNWNGRQLISREHALKAVTSPLPNSIPRTKAEVAEMCPDPRSIGSRSIPDNQTDHNGSYSWSWWINGVDREGKRNWPDAPHDTYGAFGHANGQRACVVIPSLDLVISWNDTDLGRKSGNPVNEALRLIVAAVEGAGPARGPASEARE